MKSSIKLILLFIYLSASLPSLAMSPTDQKLQESKKLTTEKTMNFPKPQPSEKGPTFSRGKKGSSVQIDADVKVQEIPPEGKGRKTPRR